MNQTTLFELPPEVARDDRPRRPVRWYVTGRFHNDQELYFIWKTHTNGGPDFCPVRELTTHGGRKKPLLYKTYSGAQRASEMYGGSVEEWKP